MKRRLTPCTLVRRWCTMSAMSDNRFSRRYFFYGTLLAGAVPRGGFGSTPSLKTLGYKSPNEKLNLAAIGSGGQPGSHFRQPHPGVENLAPLPLLHCVPRHA